MADAGLPHLSQLSPATVPALSVQMERIIAGHNPQSDLAHRLNAAQLDWMGALRSLLVRSDPQGLAVQTSVIQKVQATYLETEDALLQALKEAHQAPGGLLAQLAEVRQLREQVMPVHDAAEALRQHSAAPASSVSAAHQGASLAVVSQTLGQFDEITRQNAALSERLNGAGAALLGRAAEMARLIGVFELGAACGQRA